MNWYYTYRVGSAISTDLRNQLRFNHNPQLYEESSTQPGTYVQRLEIFHSSDISSEPSSPIGFVNFYHDTQKGKVYIYYIEVEEDYRNLGIGSFLIEEVMRITGATYSQIDWILVTGLGRALKRSMDTKYGYSKPCGHACN